MPFDNSCVLERSCVRNFSASFLVRMFRFTNDAGQSNIRPCSVNFMDLAAVMLKPPMHCVRPTQTKITQLCCTFRPRHSDLKASSTHAHSVKPTCFLTYSSKAFAPGAPSKTPMAPTRGICNALASRASLDVARQTRRVGFTGIVPGSRRKFARCSRVGMWACDGERDGWG